MKGIGYFLVVVALVLFLMACRHTTGATGDGEANFSEFLQKFKPITVPFSFSADSLSSHLPDSLMLVHKKYAHLIPDSICYPRGKGKDVAKIFPLGKIQYGTLHVLFIRTEYGSFNKVLLWVYDKNDTLVTTQELIERNRSEGDRMSFSLDKNHLLRLSEGKDLSNGEVIRRERVYGINSDGSLGLIMTNTNEPASPNNFYNPLDNLPYKHRYSGDYVAGKSDIVSIRDGDKEGAFRFFIHLNKDKGDCTGEIDGVGKFERSSVGIYKEEGGPCAIQFNFSGNKVTIKEVGGCGAYRGISCNFTGTYSKKKESKSQSR